MSELSIVRRGGGTKVYTEKDCTLVFDGSTKATLSLPAGIEWESIKTMAGVITGKRVSDELQLSFGLIPYNTLMNPLGVFQSYMSNILGATISGNTVTLNFNAVLQSVSAKLYLVV